MQDPWYLCISGLTTNVTARYMLPAGSLLWTPVQVAFFWKFSTGRIVGSRSSTTSRMKESRMNTTQSGRYTRSLTTLRPTNVNNRLKKSICVRGHLKRVYSPARRTNILVASGPPQLFPADMLSRYEDLVDLVELTLQALGIEVRKSLLTSE